MGQRTSKQQTTQVNEQVNEQLLDKIFSGTLIGASVGASYVVFKNLVQNQKQQRPVDQQEKKQVPLQNFNVYNIRSDSFLYSTLCDIEPYSFIDFDNFTNIVYLFETLLTLWQYLCTKQSHPSYNLCTEMNNVKIQLEYQLVKFFETSAYKLQYQNQRYGINVKNQSKLMLCNLREYIVTLDEIAQSYTTNAVKITTIKIQTQRCIED